MCKLIILILQLNINYDEPQGSILGSLLFIISINDIANVSNVSDLIMYTNDTNQLLSSQNLNDLIVFANNVLANHVKWLNSNKLSLSNKKSNFVLFHSRQKMMDSKINLKINTLLSKHIQLNILR